MNKNLKQLHFQATDSACLHQLFELQADIHGDNAAIVYQSQEISYREVEARSNQLANFLRQQGVNCGARVGLLLPRSPELYIAILAILKAGEHMCRSILSIQPIGLNTFYLTVRSKPL